MLRTRNNTDGNKLVIFSGIASYYGDNYMLSGSIVVTEPSKNFSFSESANQEMVMRNTVQPTVFFINDSVNLTLVCLRGCQL